MRTLYLISLPGARLAELSELVAAQLHAVRVQVLASDCLETVEGRTQVAQWRKQGDLVIEIQMTWEESLKAVGMNLAYNPQGLPWRTAYRQMAKTRQELFVKQADLQVSGQGTLSEIAGNIVKKIVPLMLG